MIKFIVAKDILNYQRQVLLLLKFDKNIIGDNDPNTGLYFVLPLAKQKKFTRRLAIKHINENIKLYGVWNFVSKYKKPIIFQEFEIDPRELVFYKYWLDCILLYDDNQAHARILLRIHKNLVDMGLKLIEE